MPNLAKKVELLANIAIIAVALVLGGVLVKKYVLADGQADKQAAAPQPDIRVPRGTQLSLPGVDWAHNDQTLLLVVSDTCRYCTNSAEFYRRLVQEKAAKGGPRLVAVLPQDMDRSRAYVDKLGVAVDEVKQSPLDAVGVKGTPTLILVNREGQAIESWVGRLAPDKEAEVLSHFKSARASD
ncbi:MAG TPA: hypothetical protein VGW12_06500 [Pyrinomonadaceae bacterium]|nr:hypothetical protein [Pyrinomonadaceae bacterium]